ncbi:hypothetical protein HK098_000827 [Nowakowskiella sp. JEL0407]|nr:hypothetical protein HK098_000827 [Nowakowskiella sp. JEL0407]
MLVKVAVEEYFGWVAEWEEGGVIVESLFVLLRNGEVQFDSTKVPSFLSTALAMRIMESGSVIQKLKAILPDHTMFSLQAFTVKVEYNPKDINLINEQLEEFQRQCDLMFTSDQFQTDILNPIPPALLDNDDGTSSETDTTTTSESSPSLIPINIDVKPKPLEPIKPIPKPLSPPISEALPLSQIPFYSETNPDIKKIEESLKAEMVAAHTESMDKLEAKQELLDWKMKRLELNEKRRSLFEEDEAFRVALEDAAEVDEGEDAVHEKIVTFVDNPPTVRSDNIEQTSSVVNNDHEVKPLKIVEFIESAPEPKIEDNKTIPAAESIVVAEESLELANPSPQDMPEDKTTTVTKSTLNAMNIEDKQSPPVNSISKDTLALIFSDRFLKLYNPMGTGGSTTLDSVEDSHRQQMFFESATRMNLAKSMYTVELVESIIGQSGTKSEGDATQLDSSEGEKTLEGSSMEVLRDENSELLDDNSKTTSTTIHQAVLDTALKYVESRVTMYEKFILWAVLFGLRALPATTIPQQAKSTNQIATFSPTQAISSIIPQFRILSGYFFFHNAKFLVEFEDNLLVSGLKMVERRTWPPSVKEMVQAVGGMIRNSFEGAGFGGAGEERLMYVGDPEKSNISDPYSINALTFLKLNYTPLPLHVTIITPSVIQRLSKIHSHMILSLRVAKSLSTAFSRLNHYLSRNIRRSGMNIKSRNDKLLRAVVCKVQLEMRVFSALWEYYFLESEIVWEDLMDVMEALVATELGTNGDEKDEDEGDENDEISNGNGARYGGGKRQDTETDRNRKHDTNERIKKFYLSTAISGLKFIETEFLTAVSKLEHRVFLNKSQGSVKKILDSMNSVGLKVVKDVNDFCGWLGVQLGTGGDLDDGEVEGMISRVGKLYAKFRVLFTMFFVTLKKNVEGGFKGDSTESGEEANSRGKKFKMLVKENQCFGRLLVMLDGGEFFERELESSFAEYQKLAE